MVDKIHFDTKISPEGRVVIPTEVRRALGVGAGDLALSDTRFTLHAHATEDPRYEEQIADDLVAILGLEA